MVTAIDALKAVQGNTTVVTDLMPDTKYVVQVRGVGTRERTDGGAGEMVNPWGPAIEFVTDTDTTAPDSPRNISGEFDGTTFIITWDEPWDTDEEGNPVDKPSDFKDYVVRFYPISDPAKQQMYTVTQKSFEVPLQMNRHLFGDDAGGIFFSVTARDLGDNESDPATQSMVTTTPTQPQNFAAHSGSVAIEFAWDAVPATSHYEVFRDDSNFVDDDGEFVTSYNSGLAMPVDPANPPRMVFSYIPPDTEEYFYRVIAVNAFGKRSVPSNVDTASVEPSVTDEPIEDETGTQVTLSAPTVTSGAHTITVSHDLTDSNGAPVITENQNRHLAFLDVWAELVSDASTLRKLGTIKVVHNDDGFSAQGTFTYLVPSADPAVVNADVRVTVIPVNTSGGANTIPSEPAVVTVRKTDATYIAEAAITDAHIMSLNASKLEADTAINKNLYIESILQLQQGGLIRSEEYAPDADGWIINSNGYAELNNVKIRGIVQATDGFLQDLNVRGTILVGDTEQFGRIQSIVPTTEGGWEIDSAGNATFNNATIKGNIQAETGYLKSVDVTGNVIVANDPEAFIGTAALTDTSGWRIRGDGSVTVRDVDMKNFIADNGILKNLNVESQITVGNGAVSGNIRSSTYVTTGAGNGWNLGSDGAFYMHNGTIRMDGSNGRVYVDTNGVRLYNSSNTRTAYISANSGRVEFTDGTFSGNITSAATITGSTISGAEIKSGNITSGTFSTSASTTAQRIVIGQSYTDRILFYGPGGTLEGAIGIDTAYSDRPIIRGNLRIAATPTGSDAGGTISCDGIYGSSGILNLSGSITSLGGSSLLRLRSEEGNIHLMTNSANANDNVLVYLDNAGIRLFEIVNRDYTNYNTQIRGSSSSKSIKLQDTVAAMDRNGSTYASFKATSFITDSDMVLKRNFSRMSDHWSIISAADAWKFDYENPDIHTARQAGVLAQELPQWMTITDNDGTLGINPTSLIAVLFAAVKDLRKEVSELKGEPVEFESNKRLKEEIRARIEERRQGREPRFYGEKQSGEREVDIKRHSLSKRKMGLRR